MENNEDTKFCKDCDFCEPNKDFIRLKEPKKAYEYAKCLHPKAVIKDRIETDMVSGEVKITKGGQPYCSQLRRATVYLMPYECGKQARFFKPKEPPAIEMVPEGGKSLWKRFVDWLKDYFDIRK